MERIAKFCIVLHTAINIRIKTFAARRGIARWGAIDPSFERKNFCCYLTNHLRTNNSKIVRTCSTTIVRFPKPSHCFIYSLHHDIVRLV